MKVPWEEAPRFGIVNVDKENKIVEFEEKPEKPKTIWHLWEYICSTGKN